MEINYDSKIGRLCRLFNFRLCGYEIKKYLDKERDMSEFNGKELYHGTTDQRMTKDFTKGDTLKVKNYMFFTDNQEKADGYANNMGVSGLRSNDEIGTGGAKVIVVKPIKKDTKFKRGLLGGSPYFMDKTELEVVDVYRPKPPADHQIANQKHLKMLEDNE